MVTVGKFHVKYFEKIMVFLSLDKKIYFTNNFYLHYGTPMPNFRIIRSFFTDLGFFLMG